MDQVDPTIMDLQSISIVTVLQHLSENSNANWTQAETNFYLGSSKTHSSLEAHRTYLSLQNNHIEQSCVSDISIFPFISKNKHFNILQR